LYQVFKMNVRAFQAYTPKSYGGPAAIFVPRESLEGVHKRWSTHLTDIRDISAVAGDHVTFLRPPNVSELAQRWSAVYAVVAGSPPHQILGRESTGGATVLTADRQ
jgi:thioesterase domain-containing protein